MARRTEYYAVLDANILIRDFWLEGNGFEYLDTHRFLGHHPAIPEVAFDEAREHLRERAETLLANRGEEGGSVGNTRRLLRLFQYSEVPAGEDWNVEELIARWEQRIRAFLDKHDGLELPVPEVDLSDLARRSIDRRRPFSRGDRGFRDTLIWLSALELVSEETRVSFITENMNDFFLEAGFAQQLEAPLLSVVEELVALDIPRARHLERDVYRVYCDLAFVGIFDGSIGYNAIDEIVHPNQRMGRTSW